MWSVSEAKQTEGFASLGGEVRGPAFSPTLLSFRGAQAGLCWPRPSDCFQLSSTLPGPDPA